MEKFLALGLADDIQNQFKKILSKCTSRFEFNNFEPSSQLFELISTEKPDFVVIDWLSQNFIFSEGYKQIETDSQLKNIFWIFLIPANHDFSIETLPDIKNLISLSKPLNEAELFCIIRFLVKFGNKDEEQFRKYFDSAPDPIFIQANLKFVYLNNAACRLFGINSAEELLGTSALERFHPEFFDKIKSRINQLNVTKEPVNDRFRSRIIKVDGHEVWIETSGVPVFYKGSLASLVFVRDISKRIEREKKLKESEERWQFALEGAGDGLWDWDLKNNTLFFSDQWKQMLGYKTSEVKNEFQEWESRVHPDDLFFANKVIQKYLNGESEIYQNEHRLRCKDGSYRWILDRGKIISYDEQGKPARFLGIHTDINDFKESVKALKESEKRFRSTLDSMLEGCQIIGFDWEYKYLNNTAVQQSQLEREDLLGKNFIDLWPGIEQTLLFEKMKFCMEKREPMHMENLFEYPGGEKGWFELSIQPVPEGIFILSMDITERKKSDELLNQLKDELEAQVKAKTLELQERVAELERFQNATIEREFRIKELREEVKLLKGKN